jgi:hypothetical protein
MKLIGTLVALALIGAGAYFVYTKVMNPPEKRTCKRLAELCAGGAKDRGEERCAESLAQMRKQAGDEAFNRGAECVARAQSCVTAVGCMVGANLRSLGGFLDGLAEGMGLKEKSKELVDKIKKSLDSPR